MRNLVDYHNKLISPVANHEFDHMEHVTLCEALDRILNKGAVVTGDVMISVADIDLIYLGLRCILTSIDTARGTMMEADVEHKKDRTTIKIASGCEMELSNASQ
jgi:gas vesicle structural protein